MGTLKFADQLDALRRGQIDNMESLQTQKSDATLRIHTFANDHLSEPELIDQSSAVPAWSKRRHQDQICIARLSACGAKRVGFTVHRRVAILHEAIAAGSEQRAILAENRSADRNASFGKANTSLIKRHRKHAMGIEWCVHPRSLARRQPVPGARSLSFQGPILSV